MSRDLVDVRYDLLEVLGALNELSTLMTPFRSDHWGTADAGCMAVGPGADSEMTEEGYQLLDFVLASMHRAYHETVDAQQGWMPQEYTDLLFEVEWLLQTSRWGVKALLVAHNIPSPDLTPSDSPEDIVDSLLSQIRGVRDRLGDVCQEVTDAVEAQRETVEEVAHG